MYLTRIFQRDARLAVVRVDHTDTDGRQYVRFCIFDEKETPKEHVEEEGVMDRYWWYSIEQCNTFDERSVKSVESSVKKIISYMPYSCLIDATWGHISFRGKFWCSSWEELAMQDSAEYGMRSISRYHNF